MFSVTIVQLLETNDYYALLDTKPGGRKDDLYGAEIALIVDADTPEEVVSKAAKECQKKNIDPAKVINLDTIIGHWIEA